MSHKQHLINAICLTLASYIGERDDVPLFDIIGALDQIQLTITEAFIKDHPELIPELASVMKAHGIH